MPVPGFGPGPLPFSPVVLIVLIAWTILWKGLALWRAAKRDEKTWFVVLLIVNTLGILEIVYLFLVTGAKFSDLKPGPSKDGSAAQR